MAQDNPFDSYFASRSSDLGIAPSQASDRASRMQEDASQQSREQIAPGTGDPFDNLFRSRDKLIGLGDIKPVNQEAPAPAAQPRASAIPAATEQQQPVAKTNNPLEGAKAGAVEIGGNLAQATARMQKSGESDQALSSLSPGFGMLNMLGKSLLGKAGFDAERKGVEEMESWAKAAKDYSKDIGYQPTTVLGDLASNPLKVVPFIAERVITSLPDMAAAVALPKTYIVSRTNAILNDRLKNDNKSIEEATFADVAAAATGAIIETTLERFATKGLLKAGVGEGATAVKRVGREVAAQSGTEALEEGAAYIAGTAGTVKGVDAKELGAQMLEGAIVGGGLGGAVQGGKEVYAKTAAGKGAALGRALDEDIRSREFTRESIDREARMALDPNAGTTIDPLDTALPMGPGTVEQQRTAVGAATSGADEEVSVKANSATGEGSTQSNPSSLVSSVRDPADLALAESEAAFQAQEEQQRATAVAAVPAPTFTEAIGGITTDLRLQPDETLNVTEVTDDKRLNQFGKAISQAFGVNVHWVDFGEGGMTTSTGRNLGGFSGYRLNDTILVGRNAKLMDTTWHELTHVLETKYPEVYRDLRDSILRTADQTEKDTLYKNLNAARQSEVGANMSDAALESELVAYVVGQQATDPALLGQLFDSFQDKTLAKQFKDILTDILKRLSDALRGPQYIKDRQQVIMARDAITKAFSEYQKREAAKAPANVLPTAQPAVAGQGTGVSRSPQSAPFTPAGTAVAKAQPVPGAPAAPVETPTQTQPAEKPVGQFSRTELVEALSTKKAAIKVTDLIAHPDIFQTYQGVKSLLARAPVIKARFDARTERFADREGMDLKAAPIKKFPRTFSKVWNDYGGDWNKVNDIVRSTLVVQELRDVPDMVRNTMGFFPGASIKRNGWDLKTPANPSGYRDVFFAGVTVNGFKVELQMNLPQMMAAKNVAHKLYVRQSELERKLGNQSLGLALGDITAMQDEVAALIREQFLVYSEAYQSALDKDLTSLRNSSSEIITPSDVQVEAPKTRGGFAPVIGLKSQASSLPVGEKVTGTPITSKNVVPSGNESGSKDTSVSPGAIPNSNVTQQTSVGQYSRSTADLMGMTTEAARKELGILVKSNVRDIGAALNARTLRTKGEIGDKNTSEAAAAEIADIFVGEVTFQLGTTANTGTGLGWYSANYPNAVKRLARIYPELANDAGARNVFTALVSITSNGERVKQNIDNAIKVYEEFRDGKRLTDSVIGSRRGTALASNLERIQALIDKHGMDGFSKHLLEELTVGDINASLRAQGKKTNSSYTADTVMPRAALYFGPKLGAFYANLSGSEGYLTMDLWWSRTFNRIRGTLIPTPTASGVKAVRDMLGMNENVDDEVVALSAVPFMESYKKKGFKNGTELEVKSNTLVKTALLELNEAPFRATDRSFMIMAARMAQAKLDKNGVKLTLADIQAALWYYEKRLYAKLTGRESDDIGYEEAILAIAEGDRPERPAARFDRGANGGDVGGASGGVPGQDVPVQDGQATNPDLAESEAEKPPLTPENVGQFSRQLVELAAEQSPKAPRVFGISMTPNTLTAVGGPKQLMVIDGIKVSKIVRPELVGKNTEDGVRRNSVGFMVPVKARIALTVDELRDVPRMIADPVAIFKTEGDRSTRRQGYKVLLDLVKDGNPVVAIIHPNVKYGSDLASEIASVYPMNEASTLSETNSELNRPKQLLYFNKGKAMALASKIGTKLPSLGKINPEGAKNPGQVPDRTFVPLRNSNFARSLPTPGNRFTLPGRTVTEKYFENLFTNRYSRVEDVQQAVEKQGGTLDIRDSAGTVVGSTDITGAGQRMRGAARARIERFKKEVVEPIIKDAARLGVSMEDAARLSYAMYAPERNLIIQSRNPQQFPTDGGSGMTNAEAAKAIADLQQAGNFANVQQIARRFQQITGMTHNVLLEYGLVDQQTINQWKAENPNYVPLRGFEGVDPDTGGSLGAGSPGRLDPRNPFVKVAKGRESMAANIYENVIKDYTDAIALGEKNRVYRVFQQFVRSNPDPMLWQINAPVLNRTYSRNQTQSPMGFAQGEVRFSYGVNEGGADTIAVRNAGRVSYITIKDQGMLEDLQMKAAFGSEDQAKAFVKLWGGTMSTLAKVRTTLSPVFVAIDAIRNVTAGTIRTAVTQGVGPAGNVLKRSLRAAQTAWKAERDNNWAGVAGYTVTINPPGQPPVTLGLRDLYDMYRADGGKVGFLDIQEIDQIQKDIQSLYRAASVAGSFDPKTYPTQALGYIKRAEEFIMDAAGSIETSMRFAAYMDALERGKTRMEATNMAKEVTVNFDAKGKWTPQLGMLYMFANAGVQGTRNFGKVAFGYGWKSAAMWGGLTGLGYALAAMSAAMSGDDDQPYWDKQVHKQAKLKNLVIFTPTGDRVTIPMPYGYGFVVNLGYAMHDLQRGVPLAKVASFMADSMFTHFSPFGSVTENPLTAVAPTLLDPIAVVTTNKTEQGLPLAPESPYDKSQPDSEKFWQSSRGTAVQRITQWANSETGGTQAYEGAVSVSPETVKFVYGWLTGGIGSFARDTGESIFLTSEVGASAAFDKNKIPVVKSFFQNNTGRADQIEYYKNSQEAEAALDRWKKLFNSPDRRRDDVAEKLFEERKLRELGGSVNAYQQALKGLRLEEIKIVDKRTAGDFDAAEAEERLARVGEKKLRLFTQFNRAFYRASPETPGEK